jgi:hypothetical protein
MENIFYGNSGPLDFTKNSAYMSYCEKNNLMPTDEGFRQWIDKASLTIKLPKSRDYKSTSFVATVTIPSKQLSELIICAVDPSNKIGYDSTVQELLDHLDSDDCEHESTSFLISNRPLCYKPEEDNPYPLCIGNGSEECRKCCLYRHMKEDWD